MGQRYDVIVEANGDETNYWLRLVVTIPQARSKFSLHHPPGQGDLANYMLPQRLRRQHPGYHPI